MAPLTRAAAKRLGVQEQEGSKALVLREAVSGKAAAVWEHRGDVDAYSRVARKDTMHPQVDHCLEVQLAEVALVRAFRADPRRRPTSMATAQATELLRDALNGMNNLNVTSAKINQAKRGPFTAALNRLEGERLRPVSIEQLVRQGRGKWMLDEGVWPHIQTAVVVSFDHAQATLGSDGALKELEALPATAALLEDGLGELQYLLDKLGML